MHNLMPAEAGSHSPFGREDWKPRVIWRHPLRQALRPQARKAAGSLVHRLETAIGLSRERCLAASLRHTSVMRGPVRFNYIYFASGRSEEHTSELQSLMRISSAVFCLKKKN